MAQPRPVYTGRNASTEAAPRAQTLPLTHHEILGWIAPFTRQGRQLDLAASDRLERRLRFKTIEHPAAEPGWPGLRETLVLESPEPDRFRLTRTLALDGGTADAAHGPLEARLQAEGGEPGELLARIDAMAPWSQFHRGAQHLMALSHRLPTAPRRGQGAAPADTAAPDPVLTEGVAAVAGLRLRFKVPTLHGMPADVAVLTAADDPIELPQDLLAVLGWNWSRLIRVKAGWTGSVQLRGKGLARSRDAQQRLEQAALHLGSTLKGTPGDFHDRHVAARWWVTVRRSIPMAVTLGLIGGAAAVPVLDLPEGSVLRMVIFQAPPLLLGVYFCLRELPQIEFPPLPKRSRAAVWRARSTAVDTAN